MPPDAPIRLYELVIANGLSVSPFVWRARYALAHKGLPVEPVPVGFTEIPLVLDGRFKTVPIIEDRGQAVVDSWAIADWLDLTYPDRPALFGSPGERAMVQFFDAWFAAAGFRGFFSVYALDIHEAARAEDRPYFRRSREASLGTTLEAFVAGRESRLPALRDALAPMRRRLATAPFLGGESPNYADYVALGGFLWIAGVGTLPPLAADDPLIGWLDRGRDLYDGLGRDPRMGPLAA